jgi:hypothetical protein
MSCHRSRFRCAAVCTSLMVAAVNVQLAQAQQGRTVSDSLPREFVEALLRTSMGFFPGNGSKFVLGSVPAPLARYLFVPRNARVLGGIESPMTTVAVLSVPMSYDDVRITYQREQPKLGWEPPPSFEAMRGWGFMPAPGTMSGGSGLEFCHIGQSLDISVNSAAGDTSVVTATVRGYGGRCSMDVRAGGRPPSAAQLPTLTNPPGSAMNPQTCTPGPFMTTGAGGTAERLQTSLTPQQLLDSFARQLSDSGWTAGETVTTIRRVWTRPDSVTGLVRELTVSVGPLVNSPAGCHDVSMQIRRVPKR